MIPNRKEMNSRWAIRSHWTKAILCLIRSFSWNTAHNKDEKHPTTKMKKEKDWQRSTNSKTNKKKSVCDKKAHKVSQVRLVASLPKSRPQMCVWVYIYKLITETRSRRSSLYRVINIIRLVISIWCVCVCVRVYLFVCMWFEKYGKQNDTWANRARRPYDMNRRQSGQYNEFKADLATLLLSVCVREFVCVHAYIGVCVCV